MTRAPGGRSIYGRNEQEEGRVTVRDMDSGEQRAVLVEELPLYLAGRARDQAED